MNRNDDVLMSNELAWDCMQSLQPLRLIPSKCFHVIKAVKGRIMTISKLF